MHLETLSEQEIIITLIAMAFLLAGAYVFGSLFEKIKAPRVVGEILGGMFWGGSCLYFFFPDTMSSLFMAYEQEGKVLNIFYQLGLIFLMFLSGYNTKLEIDKKNMKTIGCVFVGATVIPMLCAVPFISMFQKYFIGDRHHTGALALDCMIGVAIPLYLLYQKFFLTWGL